MYNIIESVSSNTVQVQKAYFEINESFNNVICTTRRLRSVRNPGKLFIDLDLSDLTDAILYLLILKSCKTKIKSSGLTVFELTDSVMQAIFILLVNIIMQTILIFLCILYQAEK